MENKSDLNLERELKKFNWGAAYFGFLWALLNGCFKKWFVNTLIVSVIAIIAVLALTFIPNFFIPGYSIMVGFFGGMLLPLLIIAIVFIYVGIKGNRWAWEGDKYSDIEYFQKIQRRWGIVAVVLLVLSILSIILQFGALYMLTKIPSAESEISYVSQKTCQTVYDKLPNAISGIKTNDEEWVSKVADNLTKDDNMFGYGKNYTKKINISMTDDETLGTSRAEFDVVLDTPCSISEANCYISAKTENENTACRFYFDDNGKITMSQKTKVFLATSEKNNPKNVKKTESNNIEIPDYLKKK